MPRIAIDESQRETLFLIDFYRTPERIYSYRRNDSTTQRIDNVPKIEDEQYANCQNLRRIVVPEGVKELGNNAFRECKQLTSINLPRSLKII